MKPLNIPHVIILHCWNSIPWDRYIPDRSAEELKRIFEEEAGNDDYSEITTTILNRLEVYFNSKTQSEINTLALKLKTELQESVMRIDTFREQLITLKAQNSIPC